MTGELWVKVGVEGGVDVGEEDPRLPVLELCADDDDSDDTDDEDDDDEDEEEEDDEEEDCSSKDSSWSKANKSFLGVRK